MSLSPPPRAAKTIDVIKNCDSFFGVSCDTGVLTCLWSQPRATETIDVIIVIVQFLLVSVTVILVY